MADAPPDPEEMLAELAGLDLALARHVQAQAMATTEPETLNALGRTYQRIARSLRQTLALQARLKRERERARAEADARQAAAGGPGGAKLAADLEAAQADLRAEELMDAMDRILLARETEAERRDDLTDDFHAWLDRAVHRPGFGREPLDDHVRAACAAIGLPEAAAEGWRRLPQPAWDDDVMAERPPALEPPPQDRPAAEPG